MGYTRQKCPLGVISIIQFQAHILHNRRSREYER